MAAHVSLEGLRYIQAVTETGSFSAAARAYGITQPALSNSIARAEERLGGRLFERSPRGVKLTPFGVQLRPFVANALASLDRVMAEAARLSHQPGGNIRMGVAPLIDPKLIAAAYNAARSLPAGKEPRDLILREANMQELQDSLKNGELDIILIPSVAPLPRFAHRIIDSEPVVIVDSNPGDPGRSVQVAEIDAAPLILGADTCGLTMFTRDLLNSRGVLLNVYPGEASSYQVLEQWANLGLGVAILPESKLSNSGATYRVLQDGDQIVEIFYEAVWDPASALSATLAELADHVTAHAAK